MIIYVPFVFILCNEGCTKICNKHTIDNCKFKIYYLWLNITFQVLFLENYDPWSLLHLLRFLFNTSIILWCTRYPDLNALRYGIAKEVFTIKD